MSGLSKRKRSEEEDVEKWMKKLQRLKKKIAKHCDGPSSEDASPSEEGERSSQSSNTPNQSDSSEDEGDKENASSEVSEVHRARGDSTTDGPQQAALIDDVALEALGEDPSVEKTLKLELNPILLNRWNFWLTSGLPRQEKEELLKKYARRGKFDAPKLNPEVAATLTAAALKRDSYFVASQELAGSALIALGSVMSLILKDNVDRFTMLQRLGDAAKLLTAIHHGQSVSRKAYITPGLSKPIKSVLDKTVPDTFLYGENLGEKIKQAKAMDDLGQKMKSQPSTKKQLLGKNDLKPEMAHGRRTYTSRDHSMHGSGPPKPRPFKGRQSAPYRETYKTQPEFKRWLP